ncbi:MAG: hypothetical protein ABIZ95_18710, partial [Pyrinomonadaceae bacterium]
YFNCQLALLITPPSADILPHTALVGKNGSSLIRYAWLCGVCDFAEQFMEKRGPHVLFAFSK